MAIRPTYSVPSVDQRDTPSVQPVSGSVTVEGNVTTDVVFPDSFNVGNFPAVQPVSGTVTVSNPGGATDVSALAKETTAGTIVTRLTSLLALLPGSLGAKARAASLAVTLSTEDITALTPNGLTNSQLRATDVNVLTLNSLVPVRFDFVDLNYTGADLTTVIFKTGGSGGTTVRTLTLAYAAGVLDTVTAT